MPFPHKRFEDIAYWYFRLNGFFTFQNFVVHDKNDAPPNRPLTELDVLGVRFPYRAELFPNAMKDDDIWRSCEKTTIVIADSKRREGPNLKGCGINQALLKPEREALEAILFAVGFFKGRKRVEEVANRLYAEQRFDSRDIRIVFCALGDRRDGNLTRNHPYVIQMKWDEILGFIYDRYREYDAQKKDHSQWPCIGLRLWKLSQGKCESEFVDSVLNS